MLENALSIMMFMWAVGFSIIGVQYVIADVADVTIVNYQGQPIKSHIVSQLNEQEVNRITENIVTGRYVNADGTPANTTYYDRVETYGTAAAAVAWELIELISGTYIFSILVVLGVPIIFVTALAALYFLLLARAIVGYIRGV